ncbi:unannotated protein [freshwater metagenome]|uniref:Unannotated protein n=1 Tax=freshwater metagenome TaxID=449393 RepID=A0A6J6PA84_9ZZZZ|nr:hypothetical protein [Actinomycetota bacterium]MSY16385.1 hypothetical protein [Actinomycetota bacterium]
MPSADVSIPASSAPTDRLALGVGWVRPGASSVDGAVIPSFCTRAACSWTFEGTSE